jgi:site-specific recombinase XerC
VEILTGLLCEEKPPKDLTLFAYRVANDTLHLVSASIVRRLARIDSELSSDITPHVLSHSFASLAADRL